MAQLPPLNAGVSSLSLPMSSPTPVSPLLFAFLMLPLLLLMLLLLEPRCCGVLVMPSAADFLRGVCHATTTWVVVEADRGVAASDPCAALLGVFGLEGVTAGSIRVGTVASRSKGTLCRWFFSTATRSILFYHFFQQAAVVCLKNRASQQDKRRRLTTAEVHFSNAPLSRSIPPSDA